ncbi:MAG: aspartate aminotransferase family protein [Prochlorococcus sp.]|nr:aminotransferase class V-fold PLP-dependent enzyme [Prochlorococcaceae cyanobacterium ETNP18_MAG_1]
MAGTSQISPAVSLAPFASPDHFDPQLQAFLEQASARLCDWLGSASHRGPLPALSVLPEVAPPSRHGLSSDALLEDLQLVMEGAFQPSHPGALAHLDPPPLTASIAADLICAGLNNNLLAEELSPGLSRLERQICSWFAERFGLPFKAGGVAASGGSLSNLMALVVARQQANLQQDPQAVVLASADAHVSLLKATRVMGLAADALQRVPVDEGGRIDLNALEHQLKILRSQGRRCFAVVATAGTTVRGAVDPLAPMAALCAREGLWLHVDAAIGGAFALSSSTASAVEGLAQADSIMVNPQKLLGITKTSSLLLVADRTHLESAFSTDLPYMEPAWGEAHGGDMGLQGSRPAEVLKLWLGLRQLGEKGIEDLLDGAIQRRCYLQNQLDSTRLTILTGPLHVLACCPSHAAREQVEQWSVATRQRLLDHHLMLSRPLHQGRYFLKAVLGNPHTQSGHLDQLAALLNQSLLNQSLPEFP